MGYNLAIEYLADYEKTWMLDSFRAFDNRVLSQQGREVEYLFLEVHAEHECEHAAIGHAACVAMVPEVRGVCGGGWVYRGLMCECELVGTGCARCGYGCMPKVLCSVILVVHEYQHPLIPPSPGPRAHCA